MDTEAAIYIGLAGLFAVIFAVGWIEYLYKTRLNNERCEVCGYLKRGPLHDENRCEAEKEARNLSDGELRTREIHRINEDVFGF